MPLDSCSRGDQAAAGRSRVNVGFWAEIFHVRAGFSMFQGKGLGMNNAFENTPAVFDSDPGVDINGNPHPPKAPQP